MAGVLGCIPCTFNYIGIASAFGTLAGAILVFSTLEMQRISLNEEKHKNEVERFDSRFYPILSSFRTDATDIDINGDCLSPKGIGTTVSYKGERAFVAARNMINGLNKCLGDKSFTEFDRDEFEYVLHNYSDILDALYENYPCPDDLDKTEKERREYIRSNQILYLVDKWGITKDDKMKYQQMNSIERESFLLATLIDHQSTAFSKYIQSLRFILHIISAIEKETDRKEYYQHVSCLIGKEELEFLKCFSEFDIITDISYGQREKTDLGLSFNEERNL
ncbi:MAG: hypothetical protein IKZ61_09595 [Prevotella sp.]|nr:hypothetical protein [Prevotella sp.]